MSIEPGSQLLHYRIVEKIGEGGMGEVWRGVDTTLDRQVAIKVLPEIFAGQADRLARFDREAKVLAALSHPNIAGIYGLHEKDGVRFLAMEMVAGEELAARIDRGPIPPDEALAIALGIAAALEAAHAAGVVHRDLKPANVKVTHDGKVKVLDFGLAKALAPDPGTGQVDASLSPTMTSAGSIAGMILGTASYMSPEQARGHAADARADVWAFGVVLHEMLTGRRLFQGKTVSDVLASVLKTDPDWSDLPSGTPRGVRRLLRRCLAREPEDRLHHIADARLEIRDALAGGTPDEIAGIGASPAQASRARLLPWTLAALGILVAAFSLWLGNPFSTPESRPTLSLAVPFPKGAHVLHEQQGSLALSPTGGHLAVVLVQDGVRKIFLRALDDPGMVPVGGTEGAETPFFSPDGRWLGFIAGGKLKKIPVDGGTPLTIGDAAGANRGASWGAGDIVVFSPSNNTPLMMVPASGGTPAPLTTLDGEAGERTHRWPQVMPGGVVLFTVGFRGSSESYEESPIDAVRIATGERKRLLEGASFARYVGSGHLVFARGGFLFAVPFDPEALETRGTPVPVMEGVMGSRNSGIAQMDVSAGGLLAFIPGGQTEVRRVLMWAYPDGTRERLTTPPGGYSDPQVSPDGRRIAVTLLGEQSMDISIHDIDRDTLTRLTFKGNNIQPAWSPDGKWVAFSSDREGRLAIYRKPSDGSGEAELLLGSADKSYLVSSWSPDGRYLAGTDGGNASLRGLSKGNIWILSLEDGKTTDFLHTEFDESDPDFSPDGRWIAYCSDESGQEQIYVRPFPGPGGKWQISVDGGSGPYWSRDGKRIFFRHQEGILAVDVEGADGSFRAGRPRVAVENVEPLFRTQNYSVDPNQERFLILAREEGSDSDPDRVVVVVNWFEKLRRLHRTTVP